MGWESELSMRLALAPFSPRMRSWVLLEPCHCDVSTVMGCDLGSKLKYTPFSSKHFFAGCLITATGPSNASLHVSQWAQPGAWASKSPSVRRSPSVGMDPLSQRSLVAIKRPTTITLGKCRQSGHLGFHLGACDLGAAGVL